MKKLSILLSTLNDRILNAEKILSDKNSDTEIVVVHQITDGRTADAFASYYQKYAGPEIRFITMYEKGTGKSRNTAMANATGELWYLCDDDLVLKPDFYKDIIDAATQYPDADIISFCIEGSDGVPYKNYPASSYRHTLRSTATVSIVEMVIRKKSYDKGLIKFDERFGLATRYNTGEEFVMLSDMIKKGGSAVFVPKYIVIHPQLSSGKIYNTTVAYDKGAMIARVYGWKFLAINGLFALRKYNEYKNDVGLFAFMWNMYKGSFQFLIHG